MNLLITSCVIVRNKRKVYYFWTNRPTYLGRKFSVVMETSSAPRPNFISTFKSSSTKGSFKWSKHVIIWWSYVWALCGIWEKFKFHLPDNFNGRCGGIRTRVIVDQEKPPCTANFYACCKALTFSDKLQIFQRLLTTKNGPQFAVLQRCNWKAVPLSLKMICKQTPLIKPDSDSWRQCTVYS